MINFNITLPFSTVSSNWLHVVYRISCQQQFALFQHCAKSASYFRGSGHNSQGFFVTTRDNWHSSGASRLILWTGLYNNKLKAKLSTRILWRLLVVHCNYAGHWRRLSPEMLATCFLVDNGRHFTDSSVIVGVKQLSANTFQTARRNITKHKPVFVQCNTDMDSEHGHSLWLS
jgi:hypothetical protein